VAHPDGAFLLCRFLVIIFDTIAIRCKSATSPSTEEWRQPRDEVENPTTTQRAPQQRGKYIKGTANLTKGAKNPTRERQLVPECCVWCVLTYSYFVSHLTRSPCPHTNPSPYLRQPLNTTHANEHCGPLRYDIANVVAGTRCLLPKQVCFQLLCLQATNRRCKGRSIPNDDPAMP